jgi:two-component system sensor kinase FixL
MNKSDSILDGQDAAQTLRMIRSAVEHAYDAVVITDAQLEPPGPRIVYVNRAFETMTGYAASEVIGKSPRLLHGPKTDRRTLDRLRTRLANGEPLEGQTVNYRKDGSELMAEWRINAVRDDAGRTTHFVSVQRDVTSLRQAEARARERERVLMHVSRLSTAGQLASAIAHQLNQPLFAISTYAAACRIALGAGAAPDQIVSDLSGIEGAVDTAGKLVRRFRESTHARQRHVSTVCLETLARETVSMVQGEARRKDIGMHVDVDGTIPMVLADSVLVQHALFNLIRNAMDAVDSPEIADREVGVRLSADGGAVSVTVSDTGVGAPDDDLGRLFEPLRTTKAGGLGLGLWTTRSIVESHHGRLEAMRNPGRGLSFRLTLPVPTESPKTSKPES